MDFKDFFLFAPGTMIAANSYLLVYFDDRTDNPGVHTTFTQNGTNVTFTLKAAGDTIHLYQGDLNSGFTLRTSVLFGPQIPDLAIGRVPDVTGDFTLTQPSPNGGGRPFAANTAVPFELPPTVASEFTLKINEWVATNSTNPNDDWLEIYNPGTNIISLTGLALVDTEKDFSKAGNFVKALSFIGPLGFAVFIADGKGNNPDALDFGLSSSNGDQIWLYAANQTTVIDQVDSTLIRRPDVSEGRVPDGSTNIVVLPSMSPGERNFGNITEIVISEVLPHTDPPLEDAIELHNPTANPVDISYWWLTNDPDVPKKFRIPAGTIVAPGGFVVFYEGRPQANTPKSLVGFNRAGTDSGTNFTLNSARGDEVYLFKGRADGTVTGDRRGIDFGPSENGVSFGRYITSEGESDIVAMEQRTFGQDSPSTVHQFRQGTGKTNSSPKVGPVVITEIVYDVGTVDEELYEFIELRNISDDIVPLYDPAFPTNQWRIKDGVAFTFPPNQSLAPDEYALVVNFDPDTNTTQLASFRIAYPNIPDSVKIYGPYGGTLNNSGDTIELAKPDAPQAVGRVDEGLVPYYVIDRVKYNNNAPWPEVENTVFSLQRKVESEYGNDPINWKGFAENPTPGRFNSALGTEPPRITAQPQSQTVQELFNASLTVGARGGDRSYQWTLNGVNIEHGTNATLEFVGVSPSDAGDYQVLLNNAAGSVTSSVATLTVTLSPPDSTRPAITITSPANNARVTDSTVELRGTASDNTALDRIEYKVGDGSFLTANGRTSWDAQLTLEPGTNVITVRAIDTSDNMATGKVHRLVYVVTSAIDISKTGTGTVTGVTDGQLLEVGRSYTVTATPGSGFVFSNWSGGVSGTSSRLTFPMQADLSIVANFIPNPFTAVDGKFNGLFYDPNAIEHGSSGFFKLTVTERGSYTALLTVGGRKHSTSGQLDLEGKATNTIVRPGTNALSVEWSVALDDSDRVSGTVSDGSWTAELNGDRATFGRTNPNPDVRKYTFVIPGMPGATDSPAGDGYGTVSIDVNGNVSLKGFLADKTPFSQKVPLSKNGEWPFFASLYASKGSILGWIALTNDASEIQGNVNWSKPALVTSKYYPGGFNESYTMLGARYVAPPSGTRILNLPNGEVILTDGNLAAGQTNQVTLGTNNKVTNDTPDQKLVVTFVLPTGLFKGNFTPAGATRAVPFAGAVLQGENFNWASGFFLGTSQSGRILLQAPAP